MDPRILLIVLLLYISAPYAYVDAVRSWDETEDGPTDHEFMRRVRRFGGPLCDLVFGLKAQDSNYMCEPTRNCGSYDAWMESTNNNVKGSKKIVVSIGHNGFGNQLFQHLFAQNAAQYSGAQLYLTSMDVTSIGKRVPQNTVQGSRWAASMADPRLRWDQLPSEHYAKSTCAHRNATLLVRAVDFRSKHRNATAVRHDLLQFLDPISDINCLVLVGYFQNRANSCMHHVRSIFSGLQDLLRSELVLPFTERDIVLHLRCAKNAFPGYGTAYIATILNRTIWDHIYIVKPPGPCGGRTYKPVLKYILDKYSNRVVFSPGNSTGLNEFLTLARANKFVQDKHSTFSFWAGYFSVGTEVHIDIAGLQPAYPLRDDKFVYHDESKSSYFGSYGKDDSGRGKNRIHFAYIHDMG